MSKFRLFPVYCLLAVCLMFTSCTSAPAAPLDILPLSMAGVVTADGIRYNADAYFDEPARGRLMLDDVTYEVDGTAVTMTLAGLTLPVALTPPALEFLNTLSSLESEEIVSTESDGRYVTAVYSHGTSEVTVVYEDGRPIKAESGSITFETETTAK